MGVTEATWSRSAAFAACALLIAVEAKAQPTVPESELRRCVGIAADIERLACFDALARSTVGTLEVEENTAPPSSATPEPATEDIDAFGAELIGGGTYSGPEEIQSHLIGEFTGWRGNTEFALKNGQRWQQTEPGRLVFRAEAPLVTIRRGSFNTYRLSVEGVNRAVRVRRIE